MEKDNDNTPQKGDCFFRTADTKLAVAMCTVGFQPHKSDPIVRRVNKNGVEELFFNLSCKSKDGLYDSGQAYKAWKQGTEYIEQNPDDHLAIAMCTLKNYTDILELVKRKKRLFEYDIGNMTIYVTEGSKKQQILEKKYAPTREHQPKTIEYPKD